MPTAATGKCMMPEHDDLYEGDEPGEEEVEEIVPDEKRDGLEPRRIMLYFTGVEDGDLEDVVDGVVDDANRRGLFFEWGSIGEMEMSSVIKGSPLHQVLTGKQPD